MEPLARLAVPDDVTLYGGRVEVQVSGDSSRRDDKYRPAPASADGPPLPPT